MTVLAVLAFCQPWTPAPPAQQDPSRRSSQVQNVKTNGRKQCVEIGRFQAAEKILQYVYVYIYNIFWTISLAWGAVRNNSFLKIQG